MRSTVYTCDVCPAIRQQANHWRLVRVNANGFHLSEWDDDEAAREDIRHVCGFECATKLLGRYMEGVSIKPFANTEPSG